jgi:UDP:flavonoid glycosyltransferase YjiC (YdhE family)
MQIVLTCLGTTNDVQSLVALATELRRYGHQFVFALPSQLLPYAQRLGFEAVLLGPDLSGEFFHLHRLVTEGQAGEEDWLSYNQVLLAAAPQALQQLFALCNEADLLISVYGMPLGRIVHDLTGIPFVSVRLCYLESVTVPDAQDGSAEDYSANLFRSQLGLSPDSLEAHDYSPQLTLFALSHEFLSPGPDWPEHFYVPGFFFMDEEDWQPDPGLTAFLQAGPAPVVITLGSMIYNDPVQITKLLLAAVKAAGCRAVIQHGWAGLAKGMHLPNTIYAADYIPHSWLFPQAACVVCHAGGNIATAFRAGVPVVPIPHASDQFVSARWAQDVGCASAVIPYQELNAERLAAAIADSLTDERYRVAAVALSERIRPEQGVQTARKLIEQLVQTVAWRTSGQEKP